MAKKNLRAKIDMMDQLFSRLKSAEAVKPSGDFTKGEISVLENMYKNSESQLLAGDISKSLGIGSGQLANVLNLLEDKGLIERNRDAFDKRKVYVCLTPSGSYEGKKIVDQKTALFASAIDSIGNEEYVNFISLANKVMDIIENNNKDKEADVPSI